MMERKVDKRCGTMVGRTQKISKEIVHVLMVLLFILLCSKFPPEADGFNQYNALHQRSAFGAAGVGRRRTGVLQQRWQPVEGWYTHQQSSGYYRHPTGKSSQTSSPFSRSSSSSPLRMVMTLPTEIIENVTTQNLLDDLINETVRTSARKTIMMQFDPSSGWIWRRWKGTVFSETWASCVQNMALAMVIMIVLRMIPGAKKHLQGFSILWGQLLSVTTFTLTFFVNQSYALWRKCYELSRRLQGRLNDLGMTLSAHAARKEPTNPYEPAQYTDASKQLLTLIGRYIRIFNLFTYASFTRSHRPVLTPRGMTRMVERGLMTPTEKQVLVDAEVAPTQRHNAVILWIMRCFVEGCRAGHFQGGDGFEQQFLEKAHVIRSQYGAIGDELQGRMPLAYAHLVQILVDTVLYMYPVMAFTTEMTPFLGVVGTGLLTMSYQGLFELAKHFLDPYDNENYGKGDDPLSVDTLIAETNSGSVRWMNSFAQMPFSKQAIVQGKLDDSLLPLRGYTVEEAARLEEERRQKEQELIAKLEEEAAAAEAEAAASVAASNDKEPVNGAHPMNESSVEAGIMVNGNSTDYSPQDGAVHVDLNGAGTNSTYAASSADTALTEQSETNGDTEDTEEIPSHTVYQLEDGSPISIVRRDGVVQEESELTGFEEPPTPAEDMAEATLSDKETIDKQDSSPIASDGTGEAESTPKTHPPNTKAEVKVIRRGFEAELEPEAPALVDLEPALEVSTEVEEASVSESAPINGETESVFTSTAKPTVNAGDLPPSELPTNGYNQEDAGLDSDFDTDSTKGVTVFFQTIYDETDRGSMYIEANPELAKPLQVPDAVASTEEDLEDTTIEEEPPSTDDDGIQQSGLDMYKPGPKTLEDFKRDAEQRKELLEEELRATMEILSAPPNYDNFDAVDEHKHKPETSAVDECDVDDPECVEEVVEEEHLAVENLPEIATQILAEVEAEKKKAEEEAAKAQEELDKRSAIDGEALYDLLDEDEVQASVETMDSDDVAAADEDDGIPTMNGESATVDDINDKELDSSEETKDDLDVSLPESDGDDATNETEVDAQPDDVVTV